MSEVLKMFKEFQGDPEAWDMYVTGRPGTGKTTELRHSVQYLMDTKAKYIVCAYTHKACNILRGKLPEGAEVATLHSFLKKRPTINQHATSRKTLELNKQMSTPDKVDYLIIDEYSMIGEKDGVDIRALQDPEYEGAPVLKVLWIGDPNQLDSIGDAVFVYPEGKYQMTLTKIWRQGEDNPLRVPLGELDAMISGAPMKPLTANDNFIRGKNIVKMIADIRENGEELDYVCLAYTNKRVEQLNAEIEGVDEPYEGCMVHSPTTKQNYKFLEWEIIPSYIDTPFNGDLHLNSKYETLEYLIKTGNCRFAQLEHEDGYIVVAAVIFGHYQYKLMADQLKNAAAKSNKVIEDANRGFKAAAWAKNNPKSKLARERAKAWRDFLSFDECVMCIDFPHAMTVHKSQGSTYDTVFIDTDDLYLCARTNVKGYLKLMNVAMSRASNRVITN